MVVADELKVSVINDDSAIKVEYSKGRHTRIQTLSCAELSGGNRAFVMIALGALILKLHLSGRLSSMNTWEIWSELPRTIGVNGWINRLPEVNLNEILDFISKKSMPPMNDESRPYN